MDDKLRYICKVSQITLQIFQTALNKVILYAFTKIHQTYYHILKLLKIQTVLKLYSFYGD
ncbi:hypothetical protein T12_7253 [Trichinella patagoniensis]|uniref:Uncharacterized protein n=1 Tax=Trichinella patagoniensis TaxID=990121 RepID=A0A0V1AC40_9BILA|nr:hypothetical protein T12_7253 [Trichinella patagoniensis]